jgi:cytochrome c-type biogenesis protein CcmI
VINFYIGAAICVLVAAVFIVFPWLAAKNNPSNKTLSNKNLIKQRLDELEFERQQGLLSDIDKQQSENELTMAFLDEADSPKSQQVSSKIALVLGGLLSVLVGTAVYWQANQVQRVDNWQIAQQQTSELGQRMLQGDESLTFEDLQTFALGLRSKLVDTPKDSVGWMLLGRVSGALNRVDSAIQAFEKSLQYDPNNTGTLSSYAQALLMSGQEEQILKAKRVLLQILNLEPDNTNAMGVLAIVASELKDKPLALENWQRLLGYIPASDANYAAVKQRITQLEQELNPTQQAQEPISASKRVSITVDISQDLKAKLPAQGFLFVFAQEPTGKVRMPAAVVKMPLSTFPLVVELSNSNAMMPNYTLSQLQQAKLVARISLDEDVSQAPGELQGEILVDLQTDATSEETITINRELE